AWANYWAKCGISGTSLRSRTRCRRVTARPERPELESKEERNEVTELDRTRAGDRSRHRRCHGLRHPSHGYVGFARRWDRIGDCGRYSRSPERNVSTARAAAIEEPQLRVMKESLWHC